MPVTLVGNPHSGEPAVDFTQFNFDAEYDYPNGLNLRPGSPMHDYIVNQVLERANDSTRALQARMEISSEIERTLTSYMPLSIAEKKMKKIDSRKPLPVVVPITYSSMETLLTYMVVAFLQEPMFQYEGIGPEDHLGSMLLERIIQIQNHRAKNAAALHTQWRDAFAHGFGAIHLPWRRKLSRRTLRRDRIRFSELLQDNVVAQQAGQVSERVMFEGTMMENIATDRYLPDPSVPIHMVQEGEFVGWSDPTTRTSMLGREQVSDGFIFNCLYLHAIQDGTSKVVTQQSARNEKHGVTYRGQGAHLRPVDVIWMYVDLIPGMFGPEGDRLGDSMYPEKWVFGVAADRVVIAAEPVDADHGMFPVAVCAPETDGYSVSPVGTVEMTYGIQQMTDFSFNSHNMNVRKALNDMFVVDPSVINVRSLKEPGPGKLIYLKRSQWGMNKLDNAIKQFPVTDVTSNNMRDVGMYKQLMEDLMGTQDILRGNQPRGRDRVTATEVRGAQSGSLKKMEKKARMIGIQSNWDAALIMAYNTIQFMTDETYVKLAGRFEEELRYEYQRRKAMNPESGRVRVNPLDLDVAFDVIAHDGTFPGDATSQQWIQLYQVIANNEGLTATFDMTRIFLHIARLLGARNVTDFVQRGGQNVVPIPADPEKVIQQADRGNIIPIGGEGVNNGNGQRTNGAVGLAGAF